jgi:hypothetical protein
MTTLFVVCAALGGTVLVLQFLLSLIGLGGDSLGGDLPHDVGHGIGGLDHDFSGDVHGGGDFQADAAGHDVQGGDHADHGTTHHDSSWLFRVVSFRTIVAALAFFGLTGLAANAYGASPPRTLGIALLAGLAAMYAVYAMMEAMRTLKAEGTVRIQRAVGKQASVYLRIPPNNSGSGKIHINLQNRTMEYFASTPGEAIPTGATVVVTDVIGPDTVQVEHVPIESERSSHV